MKKLTCPAYGVREFEDGHANNLLALRQNLEDPNGWRLVEENEDAKPIDRLGNSRNPKGGAPVTGTDSKGDKA